ncbi:MAG: response regulator [Desulfobacterales bacterium]|nr:response regulator [Desulfobacterales bacterium]
MPKILAIDDIRENLDMLSAVLQRLIPECTVIVARSGKEGIEIANKELPDAILLDIVMPGIDGFEVCRQLKSVDETMHIPVIMLTGVQMDTKTRVKGLDVGADAFLTKPVESIELVAQVNVMLRIKRVETLLMEEKNKLTEEVENRTRSLKALTESNRALLHANNEQELVQDICQIIVKQGRYKLSWVAYAEKNEEKSVRMIAQYGYNDGYLESLNISWGDGKNGHGPIGRTIRTGRLHIVREISTNEKYKSWREEAIRHGYASIVSLPIILNDKTIGALNIYAEDSNAFDKSEVELLMELSRDLSYGIMSMRMKLDRERAEKHIHLLTQELIKAQETERQRIARDLHDKIAQDLATLKIASETIFDKYPGVVSDLSDKFTRFSEILKESIDSVRNLAHDLQPPSIERIGLVNSMYQHCQDFAATSGIKVDFFSAGIEELNLNFDTGINLYRLIQESLNNVNKHAGCKNVTIKFIASYPNIILRIEDDGIGFNVDKRLLSALKEKRMGLKSMEERVNLLNGKFNIQSKRGMGTKLFIEVPYKAKKQEVKSSDEKYYPLFSDG